MLFCIILSLFIIFILLINFRIIHMVFTYLKYFYIKVIRINYLNKCLNVKLYYPTNSFNNFILIIFLINF